jgi:hypothetical protein
MAEALAVVGLVSSIVQFIDFSSKIISRLNDFHDAAGGVPKAFRDIKIELPLLLDTLKRTQKDAEGGSLSIDTQNALIPVIEGCRVQVTELDAVLLAALPPPRASWLRKSFKAVSSVRQDEKVQRITTSLRGYVQTLTYHQVTRPNVTLVKPKVLFMVPFERDTKFVGRGNTLLEIEKRFENQSRIALAGIGGVG